jgi:hypothetical protein
LKKSLKKKIKLKKTGVRTFVSYGMRRNCRHFCCCWIFLLEEISLQLFVGGPEKVDRTKPLFLNATFC